MKFAPVKISRPISVVGHVTRESTRWASRNWAPAPSRTQGVQEPRAVGDADMEVQRPTSPLGELFDPMSVLVEDAVSFEPPELVYDFIDRLFTHQLPPPAGAPLQSKRAGRANCHARARRADGHPSGSP